ncbi:hypothetical protein V5R04_07185 [Jonesiaceae bacterium BS-20]|uniref:Uncharacterized protein n=1 Tax=Jonesiaceae bacterium BS-20 TaxID=3120821 RepID=A0AAU7E0A9_9MICO
MTTMNTNRIPAGVTTGGQFATGTRTEADVALTSAPIPAADTDMTPEQLMAAALNSANYHSRVKGLRFTPPEDIAQDTIAQVLEARRKDPTRVITTAYVHQIAYGFVAHRTRGNLSAADRKAIGIYQSRIDAQELTMDRPMTSKERDLVAADIRAGWHDQRRKPSLDFVARAARGRTLSLDAPVGTDESAPSLLDYATQGYVYKDEDALAVEPDSITAKAIALAGDRQKAEAKDQLWEAMREGSPELPEPLVGTMARREGLVHQRAMKEVGVRAAVNDWNTGNDDSAAAVALFAPFGDIGPDEKDEVAALFTRNESYADQLYDIVVKKAMVPTQAQKLRTA